MGASLPCRSQLPSSHKDALRGVEPLFQRRPRLQPVVLFDPQHDYHARGR